MHPPSFPNFFQFAALCGILDQGEAEVHILQPTVLDYWVESFSPDFSLQAVMCFLQVLVLNTFAVGPKLFPYVEKFEYLWPF